MKLMSSHNHIDERKTECPDYWNKSRKYSHLSNQTLLIVQFDNRPNLTIWTLEFADWNPWSKLLAQIPACNSKSWKQPYATQTKKTEHALKPYTSTL